MYSVLPRNDPTHHLALPSPARSSPCSQEAHYSCHGHQAYIPGGLCTPPTDENKMGTTFELPHLASCENYPIRHHASYAPALPSSDRRRSVLNERSVPNEQMFNPTSRRPAPTPTPTHFPSYTQAAAPSRSQPVAPPTAETSRTAREYSQTQPASQQSARPSRSTSRTNLADTKLSPKDAKMMSHSLDIPERITANGGNLADFMAEVAALFWFETTKMLEKATPRMPLSPLAASAVASQHFKKWVLTVLTTTQVTQNVVVLALLYIYRLKMANPTVKGRSGSEYRLLTVALMLANKFLDDNTYTNKTWADVSGISVAEIHVMEVEFLSNMRYSLLVSVDEWDQWLDKLAGFWAYLQLAQRALSPSPSPLLISSPSSRHFASPLPSPTGSFQFNPSLNSLKIQSASTTPLSNSNGTQNWPAHYTGSNAVSPLALKPQAQGYRKRNFREEDATEHPAKRMGLVPVGQVPSQTPLQHAANASVHQPRSVPGVAPDQGRLSVPSLTLNTSHAAAAAAAPAQSQPYGSVAYAPPQASPLSLPPLVPGLRAMSTVFPTTTYAPSQSTPATCGGAVTPTASFPPMSYGTPTKRLSPQHALVASTPYGGSSPLVDGLAHHMGNGGSTSGFHTPISHSPSVYLQQRNSPYKPVRNVNTLLYPPPSAFLQQYHLPNAVLPNQMHYRPLGKRVEYRTGIVPEFTFPGCSQPGLVAPGQYQPVSQALPNLHQQRGQYPPRPAAYPNQY